MNLYLIRTSLPIKGPCWRLGHMPSPPDHEWKAETQPFENCLVALSPILHSLSIEIIIAINRQPNVRTVAFRRRRIVTKIPPIFFFQVDPIEVSCVSPFKPRNYRFAIMHNYFHDWIGGTRVATLNNPYMPSHSPSCAFKYLLQSHNRQKSN